MLKFTGYHANLSIRDKFAYVTAFVSISVVFFFFLFYLFAIRSLTLVLFTGIFLSVQIIATMLFKGRYNYQGKLLLLTCFLIQQSALIFWWAPGDIYMNYYYFVIPPVTFFILNPTVPREKVAIIVTNATAALLLLISALFPNTAPTLVITDSTRVILTFMAVISTFGSISVVYFHYAHQLSAFHHELHTLAHTDSLTNTSNRRVLFDEGNTLFDACKKHGQHFTLLLFDIDHFKQVNDRYGHPAGDQILEDLVKLAMQHIRHYDIFARYGGEEFAMILRDTSESNFDVIPKKLLEMVRANEFILADGQMVKITISIGVVNFDPKYKDFDDMVKHCDDALYEAKGSGRDRVVVG